MSEMTPRCAHCLLDATHRVYLTRERRDGYRWRIDRVWGQKMYCKWHATVAAVCKNATLRRTHPPDAGSARPGRRV